MKNLLFAFNIRKASLAVRIKEETFWSALKTHQIICGPNKPKKRKKKKQFRRVPPQMCRPFASLSLAISLIKIINSITASYSDLPSIRKR